MFLSDIRDYIAGLNVASTTNVYSGKLDNKKDESIGVYNLKRNMPPNIPVGGIENSSYDTRGISILVHWNKSQRETERTARELYDMLQSAGNETINNNKIICIQHLHNEPISIDTDENGIYEYVIECCFWFERKQVN